MQIQPSSVASQAASIMSQGASKDKASSGAQNAAPATAPTADVFVEQSGASNPDRDAQGQHDGLPSDGLPSDAQREQAKEQEPASEQPAPGLNAGEEPGHLDIVG